MAIGPLQLNAVVTRTQDFTAIKQNEDNKAMTDQSIFHTQMNKQDEKKASQVEQSEKSEADQRDKDASEKGSNEYTGDGGKRRKQTEKIPIDGKVIKKTVPHFDCSI